MWLTSDFSSSKASSPLLTCVPINQGKSEDVYIWTHKRIDFGVNKDQIVDFNVTTANRVKLRRDITLHFTYQVRVCVCVRGVCV